MVLVLYCSGIRCGHKFAINVALVRQRNEKQKLPQSSGCSHFENMTENVHVCFEVHLKKIENFNNK